MITIINKKVTKYGIFILALAGSTALFITTQSSSLASSSNLSGRILLQTEAKGEAWYVNPRDSMRYFLGRPDQALVIMKKLGLGISNTNLAAIPTGIIADGQSDTDNDGLADNLEIALGTSPYNTDTNSNGYDDRTEIINNYDPVGKGKTKINRELIKNNLGKILLQVESHGEAWYLYPIDQKKYYLGRPSNALNVMRQLGLGITNSDLNTIEASLINLPILPQTTANNSPTSTQSQTDTGTIGLAAEAIRKNNKAEAVKYFTPNLAMAVEYSINSLDDEGRLTFGNLLSGATLLTSSENEKTYQNEAYFSLGGYKVKINIILTKQPDNSWLISKL